MGSRCHSVAMIRREATEQLRCLEVRKVIAPVTGRLLRTEEVFAVSLVRYRLVVPAFVPSFLSDDFRCTRLYEFDAADAIGAGTMMTFRDRATALRWLVAVRI